MKNLVTIALFILPLMGMTSQTYIIEDSELKWTGKAAFNTYELTGTLNTLEGVLVIDNNTITNLKIIVNMKSLTHENSDLKSHLRSKDFFDIKNYKTAIFELHEPTQIINNEAILVGTMTIKDISKSESISVTIDSEASVLTFKTNLNRVDYGVTFNSPSVYEKIKENAIADNFVIQGQISFKPN